MTPATLTENAGLVFVGEKLWLPARLTARQTRAFEQARNPTGRPNSDVIRRLAGIESGMATEHMQIDFPAHFNEQEAKLYGKPASFLQSGKKEAQKSWWVNPHANSALRTAVARLDRYLATPFNAKTPAWNWIDSECLPTATLLAVARDDDFAQGILQSHVFGGWWKKWNRQLSSQAIVESFPLPWPPATLLSALTRSQEEHRLAVARAARSGNQESLDAAVLAAYSFSADESTETVINRIAALNARRSI